MEDSASDAAVNTEVVTLPKPFCLTDEHDRHLINNDAYYRAARQAIANIAKIAPAAAALYTGTIYIPVVFHIICDKDVKNESVSDAQVDSQIAALNRDFYVQNVDDIKTGVPHCWQALVTNPNIRFFRTTRDPNGNKTNGIIRKAAPDEGFSSEVPQINKVKFDASGGSNAWNPARFLNVWVCRLAPDRYGGRLLGFAQFPGEGAKETDGVVINYTAFGTIGTAKKPFHLGRTLVHEIGHWLGLYHIWGDTDDCSRSDQIHDTPPAKQNNRGKPLFPHVTCDNAPNGDMFMDYMDYTDDDVTVMFTKGQVAMMRAILNISRTAIWSSGFSSLLEVKKTSIECTDEILNVKFALGAPTNSEKFDLFALKCPAANGAGLELQKWSASSEYQEVIQKSAPVATWQAEGLQFAGLTRYETRVKQSLDMDLLTVSSKIERLEMAPTVVDFWSADTDYQRGPRFDVDAIPVTNDGNWTFIPTDRNREGWPNLIAIKKTRTTNGKVEIHILSSEPRDSKKNDRYSKWLAHAYTPLDEIYGDNVEFIATDWNGDGHVDIAVIRKSNNCHTPTRIEILSGASMYTEFLLQSDTAYMKSDEVDFALADWTGDGQPNLIAIKKKDTDSDKVEIQVFAR